MPTMRRSRDRQTLVAESDGAAHPGEQVAQRVARLGRLARPVEHGHGAAGGRREGEEGCGVGEVWLDRDVHGSMRRARRASGSAPRRRPRRRGGAASRRSWRCAAWRGRACRRAARRRRPRSGLPRAAAPRRTGRCRGVDADPTAGHGLPWTSNGRAPAFASTSRRGRAARRQVAHRALRACGSPSKAPPRGQRGHRRHEPHHRSGQAASIPASRSNAPGRDRPVDTGGVDPAPCAESATPSGGVARPQRPAYHRRSLGQGREHQRPVGHRLAARQGDDGVDRSARTRRGPRICLRVVTRRSLVG